MTVVHLRPRARQDLKRLWNYLAERSSPARADRFLNQLNAALLALAEYPYSAPPTPQYGVQIRRYVFRGRYLVFYRPVGDGDGIEVVRVLHGAQDVRPDMLR